jgi:hypothetical protein
MAAANMAQLATNEAQANTFCFADSFGLDAGMRM